jgi:hypothetical protein
MNIAQLSEQLKDVPQAKLIDYAKNPNSVVPQFLALAEIQRRQTLMRAQPGQAPQSSVAEDIMAAEGPRMSGVAALPTRAMFTEGGMAGGGIVAFAEGGDAEEEYEEALAKSRRNRMQGMQEALAEAGAYFKNPLAKLEGKQVPAQRMAVAETASDITPRKGSHKYEDAVLAEAQRQGLDPALARHVLYKETGNLANPESAKSKAGALGVMQLMPKTAKMLGVDPLDPEQNIRGGVTYLKQMYDKYNDPVLAAAAYNAGPGRLDKALKGQGIQALPRETRMYIAGLAEGGEVKRYQVGGELDGFGAPDYELDELRRQEALRKIKEKEEAERQAFLKESAPQLAKKEPKAPSAPAATSPMVTLPRQDEGSPYIDGVPPVAPAVKPTAVAETPKGATSQSYFDALMKNIESQAEEAKRQGDQNKYLALMQAGFGMMASTSPYAAAGIGQGAMTGVGTYAGLEKGRREQERGIMAAQLGLGKAKATQEESEALRLATERYREATGARLGEEAKTKEAALFRDDLRQYEQMRIKQIEGKYKNNPLFATDPKLQDQFNREVAAIQNDPQYMALLKRAYPNLQLPSTGTATSSGQRKPLTAFGS